MTRDQIAQLMNETSGQSFGTEAHFQRFAAALVAAEREACAQIAEDEWSYFSTECGSDVAKDIAASIRARGQE